MIGSCVFRKLKEIVDAAPERSGESEREDGGRNEDVILHRVDRLARDPDDVGELRLRQAGGLAAFSQVRYEFQAILSVRLYP